MNSEIENGLKARIRHCADVAGSGDALARKSGVPRRTLENYLSGRSEPKASGLAAIAKAVDVSLDWLILGEGPMHAAAVEMYATTRRGAEAAVADNSNLADLRRQVEGIGNGFVLVPRYSVEASAGPGALTSEENVIDHMAFQEGWVRRVLRADPRKLALISAVGDSMEPTIRAGDLLLVDTGVNEVIDDAIYVIAMDGHLMVKRLQRFFNGAVSVKSDNAAYVEQTLNAEEAGYARIAGRVRWIGRLI